MMKTVEIKKNRELGCILLACNKTSWNSNFEGDPNRCLDVFVGSDNSLKYAYRHSSVFSKQPVFFKRRYKEVLHEGIMKTLPKSLDDTLKDSIIERFGEEAYVSLTEPAKAKGKGKKKAGTVECPSYMELQDLLMSYIDVACFGGAFASNVFNQSYVGAIQFGYGINIYEEAEIIRTNILSPFQNSKKPFTEQTTIGSRSYLNEGHFAYDFVVNPSVNEAYRDVNPDFKGLTVEQFNLFKEASLNCVTELQSVTKKDCYNELALFVSLIEGSTKYLGNLNKYISYKKEDNGKNIIDLSLLQEQLWFIYDDIDTIEIYHNPTDTNILFTEDAKITVKNIVNEDKVDFTLL